MYKINDVVVYRRNVCKIIGNTVSSMTGEACYLLEPYRSVDDSTRMIVPVSNKGGHLRSVITRKEISGLINQIDSIPCLQNKPANMKSQYATLLKGDAIEDLICIIKTSYLRNKEREETHKKLASIDGEYLAKAEHFLYDEFSVALDMTYDESKDYFNRAIEKTIKQ